MSSENLVCATFRLNMNNPQHVKVNEVMKNLNPKIYKSKNQFLVEAAIFYIEHYGEEAFMKPAKESDPVYLRKEDLESIRSELIETAKNESRQEVIRLLGGIISGMHITQSPVAQTEGPQEESYGEPEADDVVAGCALSWMMNGEGDDRE